MRIRGAILIGEDDGFCTVQDNAVIEMVADRARQHAAFDIAALAHEIFGRVGVTYTLDILFDDRTFIERRGHVMRGRANELHAALMRLMVGLRTFESRQKRMVDVDAAA